MMSGAKHKVSFVKKILSRIPVCHEVAIVKVSGGMDRFHLVPMEHDSGNRELYFDDQLLAYGDATGCPTCKRLLQHGYGEGVMSETERRYCGDSLNAPYEGLESAAERLSPILGLFKSGYYILADCEQFPSVPFNDVKWGDTRYRYEDFILGRSLNSYQAFDAGIRFWVVGRIRNITRPRCFSGPRKVLKT